MAKYQIYKRISFALLILVFLSSCNDWLSIAPENDLIKEKFWTKTEDVNGALAATYNAFRSAALESFIWGELRADMVTFGSQFSDYQRIAASDINANNGAINWSKYYKTINLANTLMYYSNDVLAKDKTFTPKIKNGIEAEALFLRSLSYFYLIRIWKEVPLVINPSISDTTELFLPKSSEKQVINQIIKDLLYAKNIAYKTEFKSGANNSKYFVGRANKYAIMSLLADVYLWDQQYKKCVDYCDSISNSGLYDLAPYETWFSLYNPGNNPVESIFEIQFDDNLDSQENPIYYNMIQPNGTTQISFTKHFTNLINKDDLRNCYANTPVWKYRGIDVNSSVSRSFNERDANFIYYRYADIVLMKAEALAELNRFTEANSLVRLTLERASMTHTDVTTLKDLRKAILDERAREFIIEGKRWFDLLRAAKRNKFENKQLIIDMILSGADIKKQAILRTKVYDTMSYYLPIPEHEVIFNHNMVQNPFYDR